MGKFSDNIKRMSEGAKQYINDTVVQVCLRMSRQIILLTPVGNPSLWQSGYTPKGYTGGQAKGNWFPSIGSPSGSIDFNVIDKSGQLSISRLKSEAEKAVGKVFYLVNNLPYIRRIEYESWSSQAPAGMVRVTAARFDKIVGDAVVSVT